MTLGEKIVQLRIRSGYSQEELAERLGVSRQCIGRWEKDQALPELPGLLALSDLFRLPVDSLVRQEACAPWASPTPSGDLRPFLIRARRACYPGKGPEVAATRPGSHDYCYQEGDLTYRDSYLGAECFYGQEVVWQGDQPIWCMNYSGRVTSGRFSGDFLKQALLHPSEDLPLRGPAMYTEGAYAYTADVTGNMDWFSGTEQVYCDGEVVCQCRFTGGSVTLHPAGQPRRAARGSVPLHPARD